MRRSIGDGVCMDLNPSYLYWPPKVIFNGIRPSKRSAYSSQNLTLKVIDPEKLYQKQVIHIQPPSREVNRLNYRVNLIPNYGYLSLNVEGGKELSIMGKTYLLPVNQLKVDLNPTIKIIPKEGYLSVNKKRVLESGFSDICVCNPVA